MPHFDLDSFIDRARLAASKPQPEQAIESLMRDTFADPDAIRDAMAGYTGEEMLLFEDESISVWYCGFDPARHVPPHDHQTTAIIGVYAGEEINHFYRPADDRLEHRSSHRLLPGNVLRIAPEDIHSVETANSQWSYGIHVYLAPLTTIERSLFDWESGAAEPLTDERFDALTKSRPVSG
jgi:predicted metal-dependent enzyme (double-stranded beta helix superfamily)